MQDTTRKDVQFPGVGWRLSKGLGGHVDHGTGTEGGSEARVVAQQLGHAKVGHLGSTAADQQDVVAAEVTV